MAILTDRIREIQRRINELQEELGNLEGELQEARDALGVVVHVDHERPKVRARRGVLTGQRTKPIQDGSSVDWARRILKEAGEPRSVDSIIFLVAAKGGPEVKKPTLVSNLSRYVKNRDTFSRTGKSTYGLIEWDEPAVHKFGSADA